MTITVKLFAAAREMIGTEAIKVDLPTGATIADLKCTLAQHFPTLANLLSHSAIAKNQDYALDMDLISPSDELAVIPPVSGG